MAETYSDEYLRSLLEGTKTKPVAAAPPDAPEELDDNYLRSLLGDTKPQDSSATPGAGRGLLPGNARLGMRALFGAAGALGETGAGFLQLLEKASAVRAGAPAAAAIPSQATFDRRSFIRNVEKAGLLGEATILDRAAQFVGEGVIDYGAMVAGGGALKAAGLAPYLANTVAMAGTMAAQMQAQAAAQGRSAPAPKEMGVGIALMAGSYFAGTGASLAIIKGVEKLRGTLSKTAQEIIGNTTTGLMFEIPGSGAIPGVPRDPDFAARLLAAAPAAMIANIHGATFNGEARGRTKADLKRQFDAVADMANEERPLDRYPRFTQTGVEGSRPGKGKRIDLRKPVESQDIAKYLSGLDIGSPLPERGPLTPAQRAAILQAEAVVKNAQVGPDGKPGTIPGAKEIEDFFNIPRHEAERIAKLKVSAGERAEILEHRRIEAAMQRVPEDIQAEVRYRANLMEPEERALYESVRRDPPVEQIDRIEQAVDLVGQPLEKLIAEPVDGGLGGFKVSKPPAEPLVASGEKGPVGKGSVSPDLGEAVPRSEAVEIALRGETPPARNQPAPTGDPLAALENRRVAKEKATPEVASDLRRAADVARTQQVKAPQEPATPRPIAPARRTAATNPETESRERIVETAARVTNAEVFQSTKSPAEVRARLDDSIKKAKEILGAKAEEPLPTPAKTAKSAAKVRKPKSRAAAETDAALDAAADAIIERATRNAKLKPRLSKSEGQGSFWDSPGGKAAIAGAAAGTALAAGALADEDSPEATAAVALAMGFPAMVMFRRGRRTPTERWADRIMVADAEARAKTRAKVEELSSKVENQQIYTGKPGPRAAEREIQDLAKHLFEESKELAPPPKAREGFAEAVKRADPFVQSALGKLGRVGGPAGKAAERVLRSMHDAIAEELGSFAYLHENMPTGPFKDRPSAELRGAKRDFLQEWMNWRNAPDHFAKPDAKKLEQNDWQDVARRIAIAEDAYSGTKSGDADIDQMARDVNAGYDDIYAAQAARAAQQMEPFSQRLSLRGKYRPQFLSPEMFDPPSWMKILPGGVYKKKLELARRLQAAAAETAENGPLDINELRHMLHELQNRGYSEGRILDLPMDELAAGKNSHLDFQRIADLRVGIEFDPATQANRYVASTSRRLAFAEHFGSKAEIALALRELAVKDGYSGKLFTELFDIGSGMSPRVTDPGSLARTLRSGATLLALPKTAGSALVQPTQFFTPAMQVGISRTIEGWPEMIRASISQSSIIPASMKARLAKKSLDRFISRAGAVVNHSLLQEALGAQGPIARLATAHYRLNLTTSTDRMARNLGKVVGASMFDDLMDQLKMARQRGMTKEVSKIQRQVEEIFRENPVFAREAMKPTMEPGQYEFLQRRAAMIIDRKINFRTLPGDMPTLYSTPVGRTMYSIGTFTYQATRQANLTLAEWFRGTTTQKLRILYGLGFSTIGTAGVYAVRDLLLNRDRLKPEDKEELDRFVAERVIMSSLQGFIGPAYVDAISKIQGKYNVNPAVGLAGPFWQEVVGAGDAAMKAQQQDSTDPLLRYAIKVSLPRPVGRPLAEKVVPPRKRRKKKIPK